MIGVLTASTTSGSVLGYDLGDLKNKEQRIQILGSEGVFMDARQVDRLNQNWTDAASLKEFKYVSRAVADDLAKQFDSQASVNDRVVRTTGHIALSFSPADRPRLQDNEFKVQLATEYMEQMGIVDTQWVITEHYGTNAPHLHIAYNRVKFDGTVIDSKNERYRSEKVAAEISKKHGLAVAGETPRWEQSLNQEQQKYSQMRALAKAALQESCTMDEFRQHLQERGIVLQVSKHSGKGKSYGLSYALADNPDISAKGSKLDRSSLSYEKVSDTLSVNYTNREITAIQSAKLAEEKAYEEAQKEYIDKCKDKYEYLKSACNKSFQLYNTAKEKYGVTSQAISDRYTRLRSVYDEMNRRNDDVQRAKTAKGTWKAISALVFAMNPVAGILVGLVSRIVTEANVTAAIKARQALRFEAQGIKADIETLKAEQADLRQDKSDRLKIYIENKEAKQELQNEINALKAELDKPLQPEAPVQPRPTVQKEPETPKRSLSDFAKRFGEYTASKAPAKQEQKSIGLSSTVYAYSRKDEILTVFRSSGNPEALRRELASCGITFQEVTSRRGVTDITITASGEKSFTVNASKFGQEYTRQLLDAYQKATKRKPAYKTEQEITMARDIRIAKATSGQIEARNIEKKQQAQKPENTPDTPHRSHTLTPGGGGGRGIG